MLISRKLTDDKRLVTDFRHLRNIQKTTDYLTDFRHLNMRIAKNNFTCPLLKDMLLVLGSSKCKVLSVLYFKDTFHSLRLSEPSKKYCGILSSFGSTSYLYQRMPVGINIPPSIWQSYINAILEIHGQWTFMKDKRVLRSRLEAIQRLQPPLQ